MTKYIATILIACMIFTGCTAVEQQEVKTTLVQVLQVADDALIDLAQNPATLDQAEEALAAISAFVPPSGPAHQALVNAQAALNLLREKKATVAVVQQSLQIVINLLQNQGKVAPGAVRHKAAPGK